MIFFSNDIGCLYYIASKHDTSNHEAPYLFKKKIALSFCASFFPTGHCDEVLYIASRLWEAHSVLSLDIFRDDTRSYVASFITVVKLQEKKAKVTWISKKFVVLFMVCLF